MPERAVGVRRYHERNVGRESEGFFKYLEMQLGAHIGESAAILAVVDVGAGVWVSAVIPRAHKRHTDGHQPAIRGRIGCRQGIAEDAGVANVDLIAVGQKVFVAFAVAVYDAQAECARVRQPGLPPTQ